MSHTGIRSTETRTSKAAFGQASSNQWEASSATEPSKRATTPLARRIDGRMLAVEWDEALWLFCNRLKAIQTKYGAASVAFLSTGQIACEEMALLGALAKFGMGMVHGDGNLLQGMGRATTGAGSITGYCNAIAARLWSNTTYLLGGHRFDSCVDRTSVAQALGIDVGRIPTSGSWGRDKIFEGIRRGEIRGLWIVAANANCSWIYQSEARNLLRRLDYLVVQDSYQSAPAIRHADLVLPAASWGEKSGTFINSECRYGVLRKARRAPGRALPDFNIFRAIAHHWGCGEMFAEWTDPAAVFRIMQRVSRGCEPTNRLTLAHLRPHAHQPSHKDREVRTEKL